MNSTTSKTLKQRIYEIALNALLKCNVVQYSIIETITINNLPEIEETQTYIQTSKGNYVLSTDGYVIAAKNS